MNDDLVKDVLQTFLRDFGPRSACTHCLSQMLDAPLLVTQRALDERVRDGTVVVDTAACLNCNQTARVYGLA